MESKVWSSLWEQYDAIPSVDILNEPGGMLIRSEFIGVLENYFDLSNKSVLEVGTGTGQYCLELARRGVNVSGIDVDPASIKLAERMAKDYNIFCPFEVKDVMDVTDHYDIAFSMGVMEHFSDDEIIGMLMKMSTIADYVIIGVPSSKSDIYTMAKKYSMQKGTWEYGMERDFETMEEYYQKAGMFIELEGTIGLGSEAHYLKRINPELIPIQIAKNLTKAYHDDSVGNWLISVGSKTNGNNLEYRTSNKGISVIIPVYNGEKYIERSIKNMLENESPNVEVIYVDDCSTDNTRQMLEACPFTVLRNGYNLGEHYSRSIGLLEAKHDLVFFLDVDDTLFPDSINMLLRDYELCPEGTHLSNSCAIMNDETFTGVIWYHEFLPDLNDYIESEIKGICGKISLQNTILDKNSVLKAYSIVDDILKKAKIDNMKVAVDSLLLDVMVFEGYIKQILPVYYTYRGYELHGDSVSQKVKDRIKYIPLQVAYNFEHISVKSTQGLKYAIDSAAIKQYGYKAGKTFMNNFMKYRRLFR